MAEAVKSLIQDESREALPKEAALVSVPSGGSSPKRKIVDILSEDHSQQTKLVNTSPG